jgi:hypothetical protein
MVLSYCYQPTIKKCPDRKTEMHRHFILSVQEKAAEPVRAIAESLHLWPGSELGKTSIFDASGGDDILANAASTDDTPDPSRSIGRPWVFSLSFRYRGRSNPRTALSLRSSKSTKMSGRRGSLFLHPFLKLRCN